MRDFMNDLSERSRKGYRAVLFILSVLAVLILMPIRAEASGDGIDEDMRSTLINTAESLSEAIVELGQEEIDAYRESGDDFTVTTMEAWESSRDELGDFKSLGESAAEKTADGYLVRIPVEFSRQDAQFVYLYDQTGTPTSFSIDVQYPMQVLLQRAGLNTLMGLGIVFVMLVFLTLVISCFRFIGKTEEKDQAGLAIEELPVPAQAPSEVREESPVQDDQELVAVIAAAIAAYEGTSTDGFVVRSIRRADRRKNRF